MMKKFFLGCLLGIAASVNVYAEDQNYVTGFLGYSKLGFQLKLNNESTVNQSSLLDNLMFGGNIGFPHGRNHFMELVVFGGDSIIFKGENQDKLTYKVVRVYLAYKISSAAEALYKFYGKLGIGTSLSTLVITGDNQKGQANFMLPSILLEAGIDYPLRANLSFNAGVGLAGIKTFVKIGLSYHF